MSRPFETSRVTRIVRRIAGVLASVLITFTLFHEVAMLGAPEQDTAASTRLVQASTRLAQASTQLAQASTHTKTR